MTEHAYVRRSEQGAYRDVRGLFLQGSVCRNHTHRPHTARAAEEPYTAAGAQVHRPACLWVEILLGWWRLFHTGTKVYTSGVTPRSWVSACSSVCGSSHWRTCSGGPVVWHGLETRRIRSRPVAAFLNLLDKEADEPLHVFGNVKAEEYEGLLAKWDIHGFARQSPCSEKKICLGKGSELLVGATCASRTLGPGRSRSCRRNFR